MGKILRLLTHDDIPMAPPFRTVSLKMDFGFRTTATEISDKMALDLGDPEDHQLQDHPQELNDPIQSPPFISSLHVPSPGSNFYILPDPSTLMRNGPQLALATGNDDIPPDMFDLNPSYLESSSSTIASTVERPNLPYIYRPGVNGTVCQLLSIEDQFQSDLAPTDENYVSIMDAMGTMIYFPPNLDTYDYISAALPSGAGYWTCRATISGVELGITVYPSNYFMKNGGITLSDSLYLVEKVTEGFPIQKAWS